MTKIEKLMQQYVEDEVMASKDLSGWPVKTLAAMQMRQNEARVNLVKVREQYGDLLKASAFTIFVTGPGASEYARIAAEEADTINVSAQGLYESLAREIEPSIGDRRTFGTTQLGLLIGGLLKVCRDLGVMNIPTPQIEDLHHCPSFESLVDRVRQIMRSTASGDRLNKTWIESDVIKTALENRYKRAVLPVIVTGATAEELVSLAPTLFSGTTFTVETTQDIALINTEYVLNSLSAIKEKLKSKK